MSTVKKLCYKVSYFDLEIMELVDDTLYDMFPDGRILIKEYIPGSRRIRIKNSYKTSSVEFEKMYNEVRLCIEESDHVEQYIDDTSAELSIYHEQGQVEHIQRGLSNDKTTVGEIIGKYILDNSDKKFI